MAGLREDTWSSAWEGEVGRGPNARLVAIGQGASRASGSTTSLGRSSSARLTSATASALLMFVLIDPMQRPARDAAPACLAQPSAAGQRGAGAAEWANGRPGAVGPLPLGRTNSPYSHLV